MPRKKKEILNKDNIEKNERQEQHKRVSGAEQKFETGSVSKANVATSEVNKDDVKHIHSAIIFPWSDLFNCLANE